VEFSLPLLRASISRCGSDGFHFFSLLLFFSGFPLFFLMH
jgi:hypothetical protein